MIRDTGKLNATGFSDWPIITPPYHLYAYKSPEFGIRFNDTIKAWGLVCYSLKNRHRQTPHPKWIWTVLPRRLAMWIQHRLYTNIYKTEERHVLSSLGLKLAISFFRTKAKNAFYIYPAISPTEQLQRYIFCRTWRSFQGVFLRLTYYIFQNYHFLWINRALWAVFYIRISNNVPKRRNFDTKFCSERILCILIYRKNADDADLAQINADLYFLSADRRSPLFLRTSAPVCVVCVLLIQCAKFPSTAYFTKTAYLFCQDSLLTLPMQLTCFYLLHQRGNGTASVDTSLNCGVKDIYNMV